jgi:hypothetical protein
VGIAVAEVGDVGDVGDVDTGAEILEAVALVWCLAARRARSPGSRVFRTALPARGSADAFAAVLAARGFACDEPPQPVSAKAMAVAASAAFERVIVSLRSVPSTSGAAA